MADFERGGIRKDGVLINEYSLGYAGPSEQFLDSLKLARQRGIPVMVKLQIGTTHELATICSLPLIGNLYEKASFLRENHLEGFMGCWNFGNFNSANLFAFNEFLTAIPENKTRKKLCCISHTPFSQRRTRKNFAVRGTALRMPCKFSRLRFHFCTMDRSTMPWDYFPVPVLSTEEPLGSPGCQQTRVEMISGNA